MYHYRTRDGKEVDLILEIPNGKLVGIEVKSSSSISANDFTGLRDLEAATGKKFHSGVVLYAGKHILPFGKRLWAMPISSIWHE